MPPPDLAQSLAAVRPFRGEGARHQDHAAARRRIPRDPQPRFHGGAGRGAVARGSPWCRPEVVAEEGGMTRVYRRSPARRGFGPHPEEPPKAASRRVRPPPSFETAAYAASSESDSK